MGTSRTFTTGMSIDWIRALHARIALVGSGRSVDESSSGGKRHLLGPRTLCEHHFKTDREDTGC